MRRLNATLDSRKVVGRILPFLLTRLNADFNGPNEKETMIALKQGTFNLPVENNAFPTFALRCAYIRVRAVRYGIRIHRRRLKPREGKRKKEREREEKMSNEN